MNRETWLMAVAAVVAGLVLWAALGGRADLVTHLHARLTRRGHAGDPVMGPVRRNHPLYRRPCQPGENITRVAREGWAWYARPPADEGL